jgi:LAS superfamily LD-carboxypeptidase LdcB
MASLRTLAPHFRPMAERFFRRWRKANPQLRVTSARRTTAAQARLYAAYLRGQNQGLPAVPPGHSDHEVGLAFDMARPGFDPLTDPWLRSAGAAWVKQGGRWSSIDPVHFAAPRQV